MKIVDFHSHVLHPDVYAQTVNFNVVSAFGRRPMEERPQAGSARWPLFSKMIDPEIKLKEMDEHGIDHAVISTSTVSQSTFFADAGLAARLDRAANERIADWVQRYPTRFTGSFTLPLQAINAAVREVDNCASDLNLHIANLPAEHGGRYIGDPCFWPLWEALAGHRMLAFIHPDGIKDAGFQGYSLWNAIGQGIEETRAMSSLIYEGTLDRYPSVPIVMSHGGGYLPTYIARLDRNATAHPVSMLNIARKPSEYLDRFHFDTVTYDPLVLQIIKQRVGTERLIFGSDDPFGEVAPFEIVRRCGFDDKEEAAVASGNAARLLRKAGERNDGI